MAIIQTGSDTVGAANVDAGFNLKTTLPVDSTADIAYIGCVKQFAENDTGAFTGAAQIMSGETDLDFRQRSASDTMLDQEQFCYTAQNTGKHIYRNTTMTNAWTVNGLQTNSGSITTTTTGTLFGTYAYFPVWGTSTLAHDMEMSFSAQPTSNTTIDFGLFLPNAANPYNPTDGAYFRLTSAGLQGVINYNGTETTTAVFPGFTYSNNQKLQFILYVTQRYVEFWYNDGTDPTATYLLGVIDTPAGNGSPCMASSLPVMLRHAIVGGAAGGVMQATLSNYNVRAGGFMIADDMGDIGNRCYGSYQGLSGGTLGSLASYANSADPTAAAALSNTAALVTGLGGQFRFNAAATAVLDGIVTSYQIPAGTVNLAGRRLVLRGVKISCANLGAAVATTATTLAWSLAFGHTAVSLATGEAATTKAPRRVALGLQTWPVGAAIGQMPQNGDLYFGFDSPVFVNPGEFVQTVAKFLVGTATASQVIWGHATLDYGWE